MDEQEKKETNETQTSEEDSNDGNKPAEASLIEQANSIAERLEKANKEAGKILKEQQELEARRRLGGKTQGPEQVKTPKEESDSEYAKKALQGQITPKE